ncbi:hypothetical protein D3C85_1867510 [compost metagenome]
MHNVWMIRRQITLIDLIFHHSGQSPLFLFPVFRFEKVLHVDPGIRIDKVRLINDLSQVLRNGDQPA